MSAGTSTLAGKSPSFYRPELDVLRFFAFFAVFLQHSLPLIQPEVSSVLTGYVELLHIAGGYGVDLFFVLSAYLITELLQREYQLRGRVDLRSFYIRRILRIWPLYFTFLTIAALLPRIMPGQQFGRAYLLAFTFLAGNWFCAFRGFPQSVAAPLWSVSLEEQFYLAWPALMQWLGVRRLKSLAACMLITASLARIVVLAAGYPHPAAWCITFTRLDPIALGILLSAWLACRKPRTSNGLGLLLGLLAVIACTLVAQFAPMTNADAPALLLGYPIVAIACALAVYGALCFDLSLLPHWAAAAGVYLGRISYGLYVFHLLAIELVKRSHFFAGASAWFSALALTIAFSTLSYQFLERPFLRLKAKYAHVQSRPV